MTTPNSQVLGMTHLAPPPETAAVYLQTGTADNAEGHALLGEILDMARIVPAPTVGRYYPLAAIFRASNGPNTVNATRTYYVPFVPVRDIKFDRIFIKTWGGAAASNGSMAIYGSQKVAGGYYPTGTAIATGATSFTPTASFQPYEKPLTEGTVTLKAGRIYFAAVTVDAAMNFYINDLSLSVSFMGANTADFDVALSAYTTNSGVGTVGVWPDVTACPGDGSLSPSAPAFAMGFRAA